MLSRTQSTKLYDIRKKSGFEEYNSYCNGTKFAPFGMKIIRCGTGNEECVKATDKEIEQQKQNNNFKKIK